MSKFKVIAQIIGVAVIFIVVASCAAQQSTGIPPAEATIWALNTQLAMQRTAVAFTLTAVAFTLTAVANDYAATQQVQAQELATPVLPIPTTVNCSVKAIRVDLRTGPDLRFPSVGQHVAGEQCMISAEYYDWYYVTFPSDNSTGWLYLSWLNISNSANLVAIPQIPAYMNWQWTWPCKKYCR